MNYLLKMYTRPYKNCCVTNEITRHLDKIANLFDGWKQPMTPKKYAELWSKLKKYEANYHRFSEYVCNDAILYMGAENRLDYLDKIIPNVLSKYFVNEELFKEYLYLNRDPRGYSIKLDTSESKSSSTKSKPLNIDGIYTDWGKYIILCPNINEDFINIYKK